MDKIETEIVARWAKAVEDLKLKHYLEFSELDEYYELTLKGYRGTIQGKPELEKLIKL